MKRMIVWSGAAALGVLAATGFAQAPQAAADAEAGWRAVAQCAEIGAAAQRHACLDDVLRRVGLLSPDREAQARRESFGRTEQRVTQPASPPAPPVRGAGTRTPRPTAAEAPARPEPGNSDRLRTTARSVQLAGNRMLVVVTADGATWAQTESEEFHVLPQPGDAFEIQRGTLGSYRCSFGRSSIYRCRRLN